MKGCQRWIITWAQELAAFQSLQRVPSSSCLPQVLAFLSLINIFEPPKSRELPASLSHVGSFLSALLPASPLLWMSCRGTIEVATKSNCWLWVETPFSSTPQVMSHSSPEPSVTPCYFSQVHASKGSIPGSPEFDLSLPLLCYPSLLLAWSICFHCTGQHTISWTGLEITCLWSCSSFCL